MKLNKHPLGPDHLDIPRVNLDAAVANRLRDSFNAIAPQAQALAARFYDDLFAAQPEWRGLFPDDMAKQQKKLVDTLDWVVNHLDQQNELRAAVRDLGKRHEGYGAKAEHYPIVCDILIRAMAKTAGPVWTAEIDQDWRTALSRLSDLMLGRA